MPRTKGALNKKPRTAPEIKPEKKESTESEAPNARVPVKEKPVREAAEVEEEKPKEKEVIFEGHKVVKVLEDGHNKTHLHCLMDDRTTRHVPRDRF